MGLVAACHPAAPQPLEPLPDKGLAHDHVRLVGTGLLARIPKQSQMGLDAAHNLAYQRACFERAAAGGHTPALHGWLAPSAHLPRGALLVEEVVGRPARLPQDLPAIARSLAALHTLALPSPAAGAPLLWAHDPLQALRDEIEAQARHLPAARVAPVVAQAVAHQLQQLKALCTAAPRPPRSLIAFDAHPGNFIVRADGRAVLVDLEKCRYSHPGLDLAHATLYTSTTWDVDTHAVLSVDAVAGFYRDWAATAGPAAQAAAAWHVPLRSAMALWSLTWCAKWRVLEGAAAQPGGNGEDWSAQHSQAELVRHVRERVDHYLSPGVVERLLHELHALNQAFRP
jgi:thiamine kinase-like enzyme